MIQKDKVATDFAKYFGSAYRCRHQSESSTHRPSKIPYISLIDTIGLTHSMVKFFKIFN